MLFEVHGLIIQYSVSLSLANKNSSLSSSRASFWCKICTKICNICPNMHQNMQSTQKLHMQAKITKQSAKTTQ